jgi:hypothetical protein
MDNLTLKFSSKTALEKIIDYINFDSSNKYTLVLDKTNNQSAATTLSRSNTREKLAESKTATSSRKRGSVSSGSHANAQAKGSVSSERKKSLKAGTDSASNIDSANKNLNENELLDHVLTKVDQTKSHLVVSLSCVLDVLDVILYY